MEKKDLQPTPENTHVSPEEYKAMLENQTYDELIAHILTLNHRALIQGEEGPVTVALKEDENFALLVAAQDAAATPEQVKSLTGPIEARPYSSYVTSEPLNASAVWLELKKRLKI